MTTLFEQIKTKKAELDQLMREYGKEALKELFENTFNEFPEIEAVRWQQYIPYFNDGDPCVFTISEPRVFIPSLYDGPELSEDELEERFAEEAEPWFSSYSLWDYSDVPEGADWKTRNELRKRTPLMEKAAEVIRTIDENPDTMQTVFGSYADVFVSKGGITVHDYEAPY